MRISAYNAITQVYQTRKPSGSRATKRANGQAEVDISSAGKDFQVAKKAVAEAPDTREDLVAAMKKKYSGDVTVDPGDFADVLLSKYNGLSF